MGLRKVEIKPIKDKSCRQVAFCKRRKGLLKKAKELSILCDVDVAVVIISNRGRLHEFSSTNRLRTCMNWDSLLSANEISRCVERYVPQHAKCALYSIAVAGVNQQLPLLVNLNI